MKKLTIFFGLLGLLVSNYGAVGAAERRLDVVATLSTFADLAKTVGGDYVNVSYIASAKFNPHFIEPKPSDVLKVKRADLLVHGGLDLELWRGPLLDAAGNLEVMPGGTRELDLSRGIELLEVPTHSVSRSEGDIHIYGNPHYWIDPENAKVIAQEIADKLSTLDPSHTQDYQHNLQEFLARLDAKILDWHARLKPYQGREIVGYHNEWPYLMRFAGLHMTQFLEPKPGIPPTPKQLEFLAQYMTQKRVRVIVQSTYFPTAASDSLAKRVGGKVIALCQNVGELSAASNYIAMLDYNIDHLIGALKP